MAGTDLDMLQQELRDIDRERFEVEERLREYSARGRGRGGFSQRLAPGPGLGAPPYARPVGGPGGPRPRIPSFNDRQASGGFGPVRGSRPNHDAAEPLARSGTRSFQSNGRQRLEGRSSLEMPSPRGASGMGRHDGFGSNDLRGQDASLSLPGPPGLPTKKKVLSSAVVVGDTQVMVGETVADGAPGIAKRPRDESDENPDLKKRNKRMFGALLGTLQRFKEDDAAARTSRLAQQREEALKRADAHAAEELQRAREHERQQVAQQRIAELNRKRELNAAAELKKMEIAVAKRYTHQAMLANFLCTAAKPALLWKPAKHCADTILLEEQRQLELNIWMEHEKGKLDEERKKVIDRTKAIIEQAEKTRNSAVAGRATGAYANGQPDDAPAEEEKEGEGEDAQADDGADEAMTDAPEPNEGHGQQAAEQGPSHDPDDRYVAEEEEDHREEEDGEDADGYGDEKLAETVEDLLK